MAVFLDSSLKGTLGRWSIIGLSPFLTLEEVDGKCYQNGEEVTLSFEETLEIYLKENITFFIVRNQIFVCPFLFEISDKR